jgi:hypothetical protein
MTSNTHTAMRNIQAPELSRRKLTELMAALGVSPTASGGTITITGEDPIVASPHRMATATAVALAAVGATAATIWKMRTGRGQDIAVDAESAPHALHGPRFYKVGGHVLDGGFLDNPLTEVLTDDVTRHFKAALSGPVEALQLR